MESDKQPPTRSDEALLHRIVNDVARATDTELLEMPALYESVDVEALERLHRSSNEDLSTTFPYHGCIIEIVYDGTVSVSPEANQHE